jgi:hypothetical protein
MIKRFFKLLDSWQELVKMESVTLLFTKALYAFLLLNYIRLLPIADQIWSNESFIILSKGVHGFDRLAFLLNEPFYREHYLWILLSTMGFLLMGIVGLQNVFTRTFVFVLYVNLHNANYEVSNGGYNLIQLLLFFHIFWFRLSDRAENRGASLMRLLHNLSFYGVWLQISLLYLSAGLFKLNGDHWLIGDAIAHVLAIEEYSLPWIIPVAETNPWWMMLASWTTLVYQILFAVIIWVRPLRPYWLLLGTFIHLGIAFVVGITDFGIIMVLSYLIFMNPKSIQKWQPLFTIGKVKTSFKWKGTFEREEEID